MTSNPPETNNSTPKIKQDEGETLERKLNFKFPKMAPQGSNQVAPVRSTSADFFIGDCSIQTSLSDIPESVFKPGFKKKNKKKKNKKDIITHLFQMINKVPATKKKAANKAAVIVKQPTKTTEPPTTPIAASASTQHPNPMRSNLITVTGPSTKSYSNIQEIVKSDMQTPAPLFPAGVPMIPTRPFPAGIPRSFLSLNRISTSMQQMNYLTPHATENMPVYTMNPNNQPGFNIQPNEPLIEKTMVQPQGIRPLNVCSRTEVMDSFHNVENVEGDKGDEKERSESPDFSEGNGNRVSAFKRLGPISEPKKPKLTINLLFSKDHPIREVVDDTKQETVEASPEVFTPVHERRDILLSIDELVIKYLPLWPWKRHHFIKLIAVPRKKHETMMSELKAMTEIYSKPNNWIHVKIKGYPEHYGKNEVLDALLENLSNEHFIPCFIEHSTKQCDFLVLTNDTQKGLTFLHNMGLMFAKNSHVFTISLIWHILKLNNIDFHPRLIVARRLALNYDNNKKTLDLSNFCLQPDVSHFIYFPLNRVVNQYEIMRLPTSISWTNLQEINLSYNRLKNIEGFEFYMNTPNLRVLDLSHNYLNDLSGLIQCHGMPLHSLKLEGNPLCSDFTEPEHYIKVARMLFPCLKHLDDVPIRRPGDTPPTARNYCPVDAKELVDSFLGLYFPLLDAEPGERLALEEMYGSDAVWSLTYPSRIRLVSMYRRYKDMFSRSRNIGDGVTDHLITAKSIARHLATWPALQHDYCSFTVDVLYHTDRKTVLKISGLMKVLVESMIEEEPLLGFVRTLVLSSDDGSRYRIQNEMVSWDLPSLEMARAAFKQAPVQTKKISLKLDYPPDDELKKKLIELFTKVSDLDSIQSKRCLEIKNWNFKDALEYFMEMVKLNELKYLSEV